MEERDEIVGELVLRHANLVLALVHRILVAEIHNTLRAGRTNQKLIIVLLILAADEVDRDGAVNLREDGHFISYLGWGPRRQFLSRASNCLDLDGNDRRT